MNLDGKVQTDKEMRWRHATGIYIICRSSNCGKTNVLISVLESPRGIRFENIHEIAATIEIYLTNLLASIEEIGYFTFSNNSDVISPGGALLNFIYIFDNVACDKQDDKKVFCNGTIRGRRLFLSLSDVRKDTEAPYLKIRDMCWSCSNRRYQSETRVQRSREYRYVLGFLL